MALSPKAMLSPKTPRSARGAAHLRPENRGHAVPFFPGQSADSHDLLLRTDFRKRQGLSSGVNTGLSAAGASVIGGVPKIDMAALSTMADPRHRFDTSLRSPTGDEREAARESARNTYRPARPPAWLQNDRQVLRFFAHFQEPVHESPKENFRVREVVVQFYLEDGSVMIEEPKVENSGIPQGAFVKRHRVPNPDKNGAFYTADDLGCGRTIEVYSRCFRITSCDAFTRTYYANALGRDAGDSEHTPVDAFRATQLEEDKPADEELIHRRAAMKAEIAEAREYAEITLGAAAKNKKLQQFLENDRKVLEFKAFWDDPTRYGTRLYYIVQFFLADDSVEIHEDPCANSGRDKFPVFWRRAKLRKNPHIAQVPALREPPPVFYRPEDFTVGSSVDVLGRELSLYECDTFTREFSRRYMNHEQGHMTVEEPAPKHVQLHYPPHTGIGGEEDTFQTCLRLTPRPVRRDVIRIMADSDKVLRFEAKMVNAAEEHGHRRFLVCVFLADDSVSVWESRQRNSGHNEGKFASRGRLKNAATGTWFTPQDFYIGATVDVSATAFQLLQADEATFQLMERFKDRFTMANTEIVLGKLRPLKEELMQMPLIQPHELKALAHDRLGVLLTDHEVVTLSRACPPDSEFDIQDVAISGKKLGQAYDVVSSLKE